VIPASKLETFAPSDGALAMVAQQPLLFTSKLPPSLEKGKKD
jgi:hypothetical protein